MFPVKANNLAGVGEPTFNIPKTNSRIVKPAKGKSVKLSQSNPKSRVPASNKAGKGEQKVAKKVDQTTSKPSSSKNSKVNTTVATNCVSEEQPTSQVEEVRLVPEIKESDDQPKKQSGQPASDDEIIFPPNFTPHKLVVEEDVESLVSTHSLELTLGDMEYFSPVAEVQASTPPLQPVETVKSIKSEVATPISSKLERASTEKCQQSERPTRKQGKSNDQRARTDKFPKQNPSCGGQPRDLAGFKSPKTNGKVYISQVRPFVLHAFRVALQVKNFDEIEIVDDVCRLNYDKSTSHKLRPLADTYMDRTPFFSLQGVVYCFVKDDNYVWWLINDAGLPFNNNLKLPFNKFKYNGFIVPRTLRIREPEEQQSDEEDASIASCETSSVRSEQPSMLNVMSDKGCGGKTSGRVDGNKDGDNNNNNTNNGPPTSGNDPIDEQDQFQVITWEMAQYSNSYLAKNQQAWLHLIMLDRVFSSLNQMFTPNMVTPTPAQLNVWIQKRLPLPLVRPAVNRMDKLKLQDANDEGLFLIKSLATFTHGTHYFVQKSMAERVIHTSFMLMGGFVMAPNEPMVLGEFVRKEYKFQSHLINGMLSAYLHLMSFTPADKKRAIQVSSDLVSTYIVNPGIIALIPQVWDSFDICLEPKN